MKTCGKCESNDEGNDNDNEETEETEGSLIIVVIYLVTNQPFYQVSEKQGLLGLFRALNQQKMKALEISLYRIMESSIRDSSGSSGASRGLMDIRAEGGDAPPTVF